MACKFANPFGTACCFDCSKECEDRCIGMPKEYKECDYYFDGEHEKCINDEEEIGCEHLEYQKYICNGQKYARCYDCGEVFKIK